ncbi:Carbamoyl-phosphate synthase small chain [Candidatus Johnevansia muelleri]|uniref:Carbamoyl phosphate synthase small chain n=1 Tax=Candidatus Johnevansia muelleri TaxID=1495769 RepID=A0A078KHK4_9GAMM|nr:Carbamoyl-phosphate synthase small chain [Candidatus Evansia muelleri]
MIKKAILALEDGNIFHGISIGVDGLISGEIVFNTSMTGYQEILTDPSYLKQIIVFTSSHIGNTGINKEDIESYNIFVSGLIIHDLPSYYSNFRSVMSLKKYLILNNIICISNIDTRKLTRLIRNKNIKNVTILSGEISYKNIKLAITAAKNFHVFNYININNITHDYNHIQLILDKKSINLKNNYNIVYYDLGSKYNIFRILTKLGCKLHIINQNASLSEIIKFNPDGIFLSNGPGDPNDFKNTITVIKELCKKQIPIFGICLGHQLLAIASGAKTKKMKYGHHGSNHPIQDIVTGKLMITSQNHNFIVDEKTLSNKLRVTHRSLFDGTLQGIERIDCPAFSFQGHPEASPGPHDLFLLFSRFISIIKKYKLH